MKTNEKRKVTGPRTAGGKLRSSRNSLKHGLSSSGFQAGRIDRIAILEKELSRGSKAPAIQAAARRAAKARVFLEEISSARQAMIAEAMRHAQSIGHSNHEEARAVALAEVSGRLTKLLRYERRALGQWRKAKITLNTL